MVQSIKRIKFSEDIDLELFHKIEKFVLKKTDFGEVKIYYPKEKYFDEDFVLVTLDNTIVLSLYYSNEYSYKRLVARLMDGFEKLDPECEWDTNYIPRVLIFFDEDIDSDIFYEIINKNRFDVGYGNILASMSDLDSKNIVYAVFRMVCQMNNFDRLLGEIVSEIEDINSNFEIIVM